MTSWHAYQVSPSLKGKFKQLTLQYCYVFVQYFSEIASKKGFFTIKEKNYVLLISTKLFRSNLRLFELMIAIFYWSGWMALIRKPSGLSLKGELSHYSRPRCTVGWSKATVQVTFVPFVTLQQRRRADTVFFWPIFRPFCYKKMSALNIIGICCTER